MSGSPADEGLEAYREAQARVMFVRQAWTEAGRPLTLLQPNGVEGAHPLWKTLLEAEAFALRCRQSLKAADRRGRPAGSASAPDRASRLRKVVG